MKKVFLIFFFSLIQSFLMTAQSFQKSAEPSVNQCVVYAGAYDWGICIDKIVVNAGKGISPQSIHAEDFSVKRILYPKDTNAGIVKSSLSVTDAFSSDMHGNKVTSVSQYITILTQVHPEAENSNPFVDISFADNFKKFYGYKIDNTKLDLSVKNLKGFVNAGAAKFKTSSFSYTYPASEEEKSNPKYKEESVNLNYATYIPEQKTSDKIPLLLWFHGMGESGKDINKVLFGTKTTALADEKIQGYFREGLAILAPQCPTGWLEVTEKGAFGMRYWAPIDKEAPSKAIKKPIEKLLDKIPGEKPKKTRKSPAINEKTPFAAVSYYTEPVKALLEQFLKSHPEIDEKRIYIGGCSAGGYMTLNMMIQCPSLFAAAFPICEYYLDSKITESSIQSLAKKPFWFIYSLNDESVNPQNNSIPTIKRLYEAGAENLHVSEFENVTDKSGKYLKNPQANPGDSDYGLPYEYEGHWSWIYVLNDECEDKGESLFAWLSRQKL